MSSHESSVNNCVRALLAVFASPGMAVFLLCGLFARTCGVLGYLRYLRHTLYRSKWSGNWAVIIIVLVVVVSQMTLFSRTKMSMVTNAISVCTENGCGENRDTLSQAQYLCLSGDDFIGDKDNCLIISAIAR